MKRLTTDHPKDNFETVLNYVYGKDGVAYLRSDGERDNVPVHEWAKKQCMARGCNEFPGETLEEIDETICDCGFDSPDCPVHLAYTFACQAVHLRDRLKRYEDTGLMPDEVERLALTEPNAPLTLAELQEMNREPVYVLAGNGSHGWAFVNVIFGRVYIHSPCPFFDEFRPNCINMESDDPTGHFGLHELGWRAYRRKPEEAS